MEDELKREVLEKLRRRNQQEVLPFVEVFASNRKERKRSETLLREVQKLRNKTAELGVKNDGLMSALTKAQENAKAKAKGKFRESFEITGRTGRGAQEKRGSHGNGFDCES